MRELSIVNLLGLGHRTNILFVPFSDELAEWCLARFKMYARRRSAMGFMEDELGAYLARAPSATTVLIQVSESLAPRQIDSSCVAELALTGYDFGTREYILGSADAHMGDILAYGIVDLLSERVDRTLQTRPLNQGRVLWTVDFQRGERFAMITIERNALALRDDQPLPVRVRARSSDA